jgi:hypothetical protein
MRRTRSNASAEIGRDATLLQAMAANPSRSLDDWSAAGAPKGASPSVRICDDIANTSFIEIGGGFGGMALFGLRAGATRWPIVDLPIMNVVQGYFLIKCLGGNKIMSGSSGRTIPLLRSRCFP